MKAYSKEHGFVIRFRRLDSSRARSVTKAISVDGIPVFVNERGEVFANFRHFNRRRICAHELPEYMAKALLRLGVLDDQDLETWKDAVAKRTAARNADYAESEIQSLEKISGVAIPAKTSRSIINGAKRNPERLSWWR